MNRIIATALIWLSLAIDVFAQAPAPVPALPDSPRITTYSISASTCACSVGFAIYGQTGTPVDAWIQVYVNGIAYLSTDPTFGWSLSSVSGPLNSIARPITNAVLTFNSAQTGTVVILGDRRPSRTTQFSENRGVPARDLNQAVTDLQATQRELWDKSNRSVVGQPGEVFSPLPKASTRANQFLCFDALGSPAVCTTSPGSGTLNLATINVTQSPYNAKCDGATDDHVAIQAAVTSAQTVGGAVLFPSLCLTTAAITVTGPMTFYGMGSNSGLLINAAVDGIDINTPSAVYVYNMSIKYSDAFANSLNTNAISITAPGGGNAQNVGSIVSNVSFYQAYTAIATVRASLFTFANNQVTSQGSSTGNYTATYGFNIANAAFGGDAGDSSIYGNNIAGVRTASIYFQSSGGLKIFGNKLNGSTVAVQIALASGINTTGVYVNNNSIEGMVDSCLFASRQGTTGTLAAVTFDGNECSAAYAVHVPTDANGVWLTGLNFVGGYYQGGNLSLVANIDSVNGFVFQGVTINPTAGTVTPVSAGSAATNGSIGTYSCGGVGSCGPNAITSPATWSFIGIGEQSCSLLPFFGGAATTVAVQGCSYAVVDRRVTVNFFISMSAKGGTGTISIQGLPIAPAAVSTEFWVHRRADGSRRQGLFAGSDMLGVDNAGSTILSVFTQGASVRGGLSDTNFGSCSGGSPCTIVGTISYIR